MNRQIRMRRDLDRSIEALRQLRALLKTPPHVRGIILGTMRLIVIEHFGNEPEIEPQPSMADPAEVDSVIADAIQALGVEESLDEYGEAGV